MLGARHLMENPVAALFPLKVTEGSMKRVFSASGKGNQVTRRGSVLGVADTCAREGARRTMFQSVRSGQVPARKKKLKTTR